MDTLKKLSVFQNGDCLLSTRNIFIWIYIHHHREKLDNIQFTQYLESYNQRFML